jgi:hypothetical protein
MYGFPRLGRLLAGRWHRGWPALTILMEVSSLDSGFEKVLWRVLVI